MECHSESTLFRTELPPVLQHGFDARCVLQVIIGEGDGARTLTASLSNQPGKTITVNYASTAGSSDFTGATGTLTFLPGDASKTISVPILDDSIRESDESIWKYAAI